MRMSSLAFGSIIAASSVIGTPAPRIEARAGDVGIIVWIDGGFNGASSKLVVPDDKCSDLKAKFKNKVSSVSPIDGSTCKIYAKKGCTGKELDVTKPITKLSQVKFDNLMSSFSCKSTSHFVPGPPPLKPPHHDAVSLGCAQMDLPAGPGGNIKIPWAQILINNKICTHYNDDSAGVCLGGRDKWGPIKSCDGATFSLDTSDKKRKWKVVWPDGMEQACEINTKTAPYNSCLAPAIN